MLRNRINWSQSLEMSPEAYEIPFSLLLTLNVCVEDIHQKPMGKSGCTKDEGLYLLRPQYFMNSAFSHVSQDAFPLIMLISCLEPPHSSLRVEVAAHISALARRHFVEMVWHGTGTLPAFLVL